MRIFLTLFVLYTLSASADVFAEKKLSISDRKNIATAEYMRCMSIAKEKSTHDAIRYIRENQLDTTLFSTTTTLALENCAADSIGLRRYQTPGEIVHDHGKILSPIDSPLVWVRDDLPHERRVCLPWVRDYLIELASHIQEHPNVDYQNNEIITATSLVRSRLDQNRISQSRKMFRRIKGKIKTFFLPGKSFADCSSSAVCSTHLTGSAVDIKFPKNLISQKLLYEKLLLDRQQGKILVIAEQKGNHYHIFIFPPEYQKISLKNEENIPLAVNTPAQ